MVAEKNESSKRLLDEIEGDWESPKPGAAIPAELHAHLDAAADRLVESLDPPPISVPTMADLDSGWDEYEDEDDEEEEEEEEAEPELPDERLDPVAYAAAKKAREERAEARRERRRVKAEAKKARRRARAEAARGKQKGKQKKARAPQKAARPSAAERDKARKASQSQRRDDASTTDDDQDDEAPIESASPSRARAKLPPSRPMKAQPMLSKTSMWMLGIAVVVFIAAALFAAVVTR